MAKRKVVWSPRAKKDRWAILEYWIERNRSVSYSRKLNDLFREATLFISQYPTVGRATDDEKVRLKIVRDYLIFYEVSDFRVTILTIFDSRRNPEKLEL